MSPIASSLLRPEDDSSRQAEKLRRIAASLVRRAEAAVSSMPSGGALDGSASDRPGAMFVVAARLSREDGESAEPSQDAGDEARDVIETLPLGVCIFDSSHSLAFWNRRAERLAGDAGSPLFPGITLSGFTEGVARSMPEDRDPLRRLEAWSQREAPRRPLAVELRALTGPTLDLRAQDMPRGGILLCLDDVTSEREALRALEEINDTLESRVLQRTSELSAARDAAEEANQAKSRFLAAAGHDLLQPLNAARLFLGALRDTGLDPAQQRIADKLGSAFESVEALLEAIMDISRLELGVEPPQPVAFELNDVLAPLRDEFEAAAAEKGLGLTIVPSRARAVSEPALLQRVLRNLLSNAVRYTEQGRILVGVRRRRALLSIEVIDTGPGIAPEHREAIFEEFRRLGPHEAMGSNPLDAHGPGVGLGLAIVERACIRLGHRLELDSVPGRGSSFRVLAPSHEALMRARSLDRSDPGGDLDPMTVLLILGPGDLRARLVQRIESWGASVVIAEDASDAIAAAADLGACPDMILAEPILPDGEEGLATIRTLRAYFGESAAGLLVEDPTKSPALGRLADAEDVDVLPFDDADGRLKAALAVAQRF